MKLLIDVNLSPKWVQVLAQAAWEAVHWSSIGQGDSLDTHIMSFAVSHSFTILTNDLDFGNLLAATNALSPSVVQLRVEDVRPEAAAGVLLSALAETATELDRGALLTIHENRFRLTHLPLRP